MPSALKVVIATPWFHPAFIAHEHGCTLLVLLDLVCTPPPSSPHLTGPQKSRLTFHHIPLDHLRPSEQICSLDLGMGEAPTRAPLLLRWYCNLQWRAVQRSRLNMVISRLDFEPLDPGAAKEDSMALLLSWVSGVGLLRHIPCPLAVVWSLWRPNTISVCLCTDHPQGTNETKREEKKIQYIQ
jgi:hypothetical protein